MTIALDAMGGDHGPSVVIPAAIKALNLYNSLNLILVGDESTINSALAQEGITDHPRLRIKHTTEVVMMDESPSLAIRTKKDSSMRVAINLVKGGKAKACVSAGNTGALMVTARFVFKTIPGIDRPAIISTMPTRDDQHPLRILDLGANVDTTPEVLFQFAIMGSELCKAVDHIGTPKVALLNIGAEEIKGNEVVKRTAQILHDSDAINYVGYIEADAIFSGLVDIVVCDGFVGNVALKTSEGVASLIAHYIKTEFTQNLFTRFCALFAMPVLNQLRKRIDPARYNGASFIGLNGIVIKSHGGTSALGFLSAIKEAVISL